VNEYQKFAESFHRMREALSFDHRSLSNEVFSGLKEKHLSVLKHPRLGQVISQAKVEVAESVFFHSDSINREIFCFAETIVRER
jgi:predicted glycosyltransferase